jgi:hypothetical protein
MQSYSDFDNNFLVVLGLPSSFSFFSVVLPCFVVLLAIFAPCSTGNAWEMYDSQNYS